MTRLMDRETLEHWRTRAQPGEKAFHVRNRWRATPAFMEQTVRLFESFGFSRGEMADQVVMDLGAGSKLRSKFFTAARLVAVEPLAEEFLAEIRWCDLGDAEALHAVPAEEFLAQWEGRASLVMCVNVLDHTFDPTVILRNVRRYLREDGCLLLSVDLHGGTSQMHPVKLTESGLRELVAEAGFWVERAYRGLVEAPCYGHGTASTLVLRSEATTTPRPTDDVPVIELPGLRVRRVSGGLAKPLAKLRRWCLARLRAT